MALSLFLEGLWYQFLRMYLWESPSSAHSGIPLHSECMAKLLCQGTRRLAAPHQLLQSPLFVFPCDSFTAWGGVLDFGGGEFCFWFLLYLSRRCIWSPHIQHTSNQQRMGGLKPSWNPHISAPSILENWPRSPSRNNLVSFKLIPMFLFLLL